MRYPSEEISHRDIKEVIYTSRTAKKPFCDSLGKNFDIWIDDNPEFILNTTVMEVMTDID
jgi:hypothetical protein